MTRALVIGRRRNGRPIGQMVHETRARLEAAGWDVESCLVSRKRDLRRRAAKAVKSGAEVVVAVGGDGAVLQVVQALAGTPAALGIIPMGTGNLLATNLSIPGEADRAAEVLIHGEHRHIDMGQVRIGGKRELFTVACGIGFDAEVMKATRKPAKRRWGKLAYVASAIGQRKRVRNIRHRLTLDGDRTSLRATQVFIANFGGLAPPVEPRLEIKPDDGVFDVIAVAASGAVRGLAAGWEAMRQDELGESPNGHAYRAKARQVRITTKSRRLVEVDGSVIGRTPITASIQPGALTVIVPQTASGAAAR
jgi:diacylglycerol kinase (ATP)